MKQMKRFLQMVGIGLVVVTNSLTSVGAAPQSLEVSNTVLAAKERRAVIEQIVQKLNANYIFPALARTAGDTLRRREGEGAYNELTAIDAFASALTRDLEGITHDKHVRVRYTERPAEEPDPDEKPSPEELKFELERRQQINFGVQRVERLSTNIGYIDFRMFAEAEFSLEAMTAAMTLVAHNDALIVDLRRNLGGDPATVAYVCSYLFDGHTHLSDLDVRDKPVEEFWTSTTIPGPRFGGTKPVYILTSSSTFSGAEEFAYDLKQLKRATLVGETTRGGANPGEDHRVAEHLTLFIPNARSVNPYSGTNWDGIGVVPDVQVSAQKARWMAEVMVLKQLIAGGTPGALLDERRRRLSDIETTPYQD
jgi:hypothetical protein